MLGKIMITIENRNKNYCEVDNSIIEAFLDMFIKQRITEITISEICRKANINHTTFYRHYKGIWQIPETIHNYFYKRLEEILTHFDGEVFFSDPKKFFKEVINIRIMENLELYKKMAKVRTTPDFLINFSRDLANKLVEKESKKNPSTSIDEEVYASINFCTGGICFLYVSWLRGELKCSLDDISEEIANYINAKIYYDKTVLGRSKLFKINQ